MYKVLVAFGTRPEAIKFAPVIQALKERAPLVQLKVVLTGEHGGSLMQVLELFDIVPDVSLALGAHARDRATLLSHALQSLSQIITDDRPDLVMVLGDTVTTLAATMTAYYNQIPVAHVEAGVRTSNHFRTFPEEGHRTMVSAIAHLHFAPTSTARDHLLAEGIAPERVIVTGNPGIDALTLVSARLEDMRHNGVRLADLFSRNVLGAVPARTLEAIRSVERGEARLVLITGSRPESFGSAPQSVCGALSRLADSYPNDVFVYPLDCPEPMRETVHSLLGDIENIHLLPPLDYTPFIYLMMLSHFVITDSGSIQEEAPCLGKPVLVMRRATDRPEAVQAGAVRLVATDAVTIVTAARQLLEDEVRYRRMADARTLFGDGRAAERIAEAVERLASGLDEESDAIAV
jgi:UDP-N-acetylglucosamine 2-epimerase (non-hydrolysing)